jgi:hypothetical protein
MGQGEVHTDPAHQHHAAVLAHRHRCGAHRGGRRLRREQFEHKVDQAIGGTARMIVRFADGHEATLDLGQLA